MKYLTILLPCVLLFNLMIIRANADYNRCPCKYHSAAAQGEGTCSRSEDKNYCTIEYSATELKEYQEFVKYLKGIDLNFDPREALYYSTKNPPESWNFGFVEQALPVLFAISQRFGFKDNIIITKDIIQKNAEFIFKSIQSKPTDKKKYNSIETSGYNVIVSYGRIGLRKGNFATMVKTPWSEGGRYCDATKPSWID